MKREGREQIKKKFEFFQHDNQFTFVVLSVCQFLTKDGMLPLPYIPTHLAFFHVAFFLFTNEELYHFNDVKEVKKKKNETNLQ